MFGTKNKLSLLKTVDAHVFVNGRGPRRAVGGIGLKARSFYKVTVCFLFAVLYISSCSTTKVLHDGEYRLAKNTIKVDDKKFNANSLNAYVRQKPNTYFIFGWNPFLNIYNWSTDDMSKGVNRFLRKIGQAPVVYDPSLVDASIENISKHLEYIGYFGSEVDSKVAVKKRRVYVNYYVALGKRIPISSVTYDIPEGEFAEDFEKDKKNITVKPGDFLSESSLEDESVRGSTYFRNIGYYGFDKMHYYFEADTISNPGKAALKMSIKEYPRSSTPEDAVPLVKYDFGNVTFSHAKTLKIRRSLFEDLNTIIPGQRYSEQTVSNTYSRFSSVGVFNSVNVSQADAGDRKVDCDVSLGNARLQGFKANLEVSVNSTALIGISPQINYFHRNIFRGGERFDLGFKGNFQFNPKNHVRANEFGVTASIRFPQFLGLPDRVFKGPSVPRTDVKASFSYQDRPEYRRTIISASYGYSGSFAKKLYFEIVPINLNIVRIFHIDDEFAASMERDPFLQNTYRDHFDAGLTSTLYYTSDSSVVPTGSYHYVRLQTDLSGNLFSAFNKFMKTDGFDSHLIWGVPYSQYVKAELQMGKTFVFGRNDGHAIAMRLLAGVGYGYGNSASLPFEKLFYSGGSGSLRGWSARTVGPGIAELDSAFKIPNQTGDVKFEANIEYRFKMFWKFRGAVFVDAGNVWCLDGDEKAKLSAKTFPAGIAADWGVGLRLDLNFLLLRVDMGMRFHDPGIQEGSRWVPPQKWMKGHNKAFHFGVGYPF